MIRLFIILYLVLLVSESSGQSPHKENCDSLYFQKSRFADTSIFIVTDYGLADTTETFLFGQIIDRESISPVSNAEITLCYGTNFYVTKTDLYGNFKLQCFLGDDRRKYTLYISHIQYHCLKLIEALNVNYIGLRVKLKRQHS